MSYNPLNTKRPKSKEEEIEELDMLIRNLESSQKRAAWDNNPSPHYWMDNPHQEDNRRYKEIVKRKNEAIAKRDALIESGLSDSAKKALKRAKEEEDKAY